MFAFPIEQRWIKALPKIPYRFGVGAYEGVVMHSTANKAPNENEVAFAGRNWSNAFAHAYADWDNIIECANPEYIAYGAGKLSNLRHVHIELCEVLNDNTEEAKVVFDHSYRRWTFLAAHYLFKRQLQVIDGQTLVSHDWVSKNLGGTDHTDPVGYLKSWNLSWADVVESVKVWYNYFAGGEDEVDQTFIQQIKDYHSTVDSLIKEVHELRKLTASATPVLCPPWAVEAMNYLKGAGVKFEQLQPESTWRAIVIMHRAHTEGAI